MINIINWIKHLFEKKEVLSRVLIWKISDTEGLVVSADHNDIWKMGTKVIYKGDGKEIKIGLKKFFLFNQVDIKRI